MLIINTPIFFLIIAYFVTCSASKNNLILGKNYNYNHPPLFDKANENLGNANLQVRKVRQVKTFEYEELGNTNSSKNINLRSEIPSTVFYDSEPNNLRSRRIKKRKQIIRPNPVQEKKEEAKIVEIEPVSEKEITTERYVSTSPGPRTVVPKVFTKRPPQDNPKIKKNSQREPLVKIVESSNHVYAHNGNFHYSFEGADGTRVSSDGKLKSYDDDKTGEAVVGSVSYKDNEGNDFSLSYTADENGYRPYGDHLPTPPPIPIAIARALKHLATKTTPQTVTEAIIDTN